MKRAQTTSDNHHLSDKIEEQKSENQNGQADTGKIAIDCNLPLKNHLQSIANLDDLNSNEVSQIREPTVQAYLSHSLSSATKRAYKSDMAHFERSGGTIPSNDEFIAAYMAQMAQTHAAATITRRIAAIGKTHRSKGMADPTKSELVKATLRGIKRTIGTAQNTAKPLLKEDLFAVLEAVGDKSVDIRDIALLLIGFAGGFRRSELVGLDMEDIEFVRQGMITTLRRSKTDQTSQGRRIGIPFGRGRWCPVRALERLNEITGIDTGPIFRGLGTVAMFSTKRLSGEAVSIILQKRMTQAGMDPTGYSGHSLRAGFATSAAIAGASSHKIRQQTGHRSDAMLDRYIREGDLFRDNAAGRIL